MKEKNLLKTIVIAGLTMSSLTSVCSLAVDVLAVGAQETTQQSSNSFTYGKVTAIDGTKLTIILGEMQDFPMEMNGMMPPNGMNNRQSNIPAVTQEGETTSTTNNDASNSNQKQDSAQGQRQNKQPSATQTREGKQDNRNNQKANEMNHQGGPQDKNRMPFAPSEFVAGDTTDTIDISKAKIVSESMEGEVSATSDDIKVDSVLAFEKDENGEVTKVIIKAERPMPDRQISENGPKLPNVTNNEETTTSDR